MDEDGKILPVKMTEDWEYENGTVRILKD
jgi:hypothetical protein